MKAVRKGFFSPSQIPNKAPVGLVPQCGKCGLWAKCHSPKMLVSGKGKRKILLIGEAPGKNEDDQNRQFVGKAGELLQGTLRRLGVEMRQDCWLHNSLACRPPRNATPTEKQIVYCRPNVVNVIKDLKPEVIILLGGTAIKSVLGWLWKDKVGKVSRWVGWQIPSQRINAWIIPTYHPSHLERSKDRWERVDPVLELLFEKHLKQALHKRGRPWETKEQIPNYKSEIQTIRCPSQAAQHIHGMIEMGLPIAFDFETEGLKPDDQLVDIVCCSVSNGTVTIAYPWQGEAIKATKEALLSSVPKIGANIKFEQRFALANLGIWIEDDLWGWDCCLAGHTLDNRPGIAGVKFQAFVRLGVEPYDEQIKPYLRPPKGAKNLGGYTKNRIREANLDSVLFYCGMDSLVEWHIAMDQSRELGVDLMVDYYDKQRLKKQLAKEAKEAKE